MDIDGQLSPHSALPSALDSSGATHDADAATASHKRKFHDLVQSDVASPIVIGTASSPPPSTSSLPPSSPLHHDRSTSSTPAPQFTSDAQKVYIARTAPHLLGRAPTPSGSRTPSAPPSGRSSPTSDDGHSSTPTPSNQSHHVLPEGYRGPALRKNDAEDIAPPPHLAPTVGSATLFNTVNFAINRNGWRYTAAGPASHHLRQTVFKTLETRPATVHWCWSDRSPFTKISADADIVSTDKGFRSARTNIGVRQGEWYAEIEILPPEHLAVGVGAPGPLPAAMKDGPHIRLGWGRREAPLNAPVGFDGYSYGMADKAGDKVTLSRPLPYGKPFKAGDVVGMYIKLPSERLPEDENDPAKIKRERIAIRYKGQLYFESLEYPRTREMEQLMERSRKGNSIEDALKGIEGTGVFEPPQDAATLSSSASADGLNANASAVNSNGTNGPSAVGTSSGASSGGGSAKVKNRKNPGTKEKPSGPTIPSLRPLPKLPGSKIGFFVNGQPQGIAFRDLFDYRPLRVKGFSGLKPAPTKPTNSRSNSKQDAATEPVINVKARENVFDDGALGYFPFISSYGGARAKLITGEQGFRFPPPDDLEAALESVTSSSPSSSPVQIKQDPAEGLRRWKPLCARFEEHLSEMWTYDLQDEARAQAMADKQAEEKARRNNAAKERYAAAKKKHAAALARNATASPTPLFDSQHAEEEEGEDDDRTVVEEQRDEMEVEEGVTGNMAVGGWAGERTTASPPGQGSVEEHEDVGGDEEIRTPPSGPMDEAAQLWSSSRTTSPEDQIRLVQSAAHESVERMPDDIEMNDVGGG